LREPKKPPALPASGHIRLVSLSAPSAAEHPARFERGCDALRSMGFRVSAGEHARGQRYHTAGTPDQRAADLLDAWRDDSIDAILSVIGGYTTAQILPLLPFDELAERPKLVIGYSDTTSLFTALWARAGLVSFYGPALMPQLGEVGGLHPYTLRCLQQTVLAGAVAGPVPVADDSIHELLPWGADDTRPRRATPGRTRRTVHAGSCEGRLFVANMGTLLSLAGTAYFPDLTGAVLVLEDDEDESPGTIDRYMTQLHQLGIFDIVAGVAIGRFHDAVGLRPAVLDEIIERTIPRRLPVMAGLEIGHVDPVAVLPIGVAARLDAGACVLELLETGVVNPTTP
jgi:muramoyltetrapeptide carboxypeptidase